MPEKIPDFLTANESPQAPSPLSFSPPPPSARDHSFKNLADMEPIKPKPKKKRIPFLTIILTAISVIIIIGLAVLLYLVITSPLPPTG